MPGKNRSDKSSIAAKILTLTAALSFYYILTGPVSAIVLEITNLDEQLTPTIIAPEVMQPPQ